MQQAIEKNLLQKTDSIEDSFNLISSSLSLGSIWGSMLAELTGSE